MTEEEAKTKWCPFSRVGIEGRSSVAVNRASGDGTGGPYDVVEETRCIASACMAWRAGNSSESGYCGLAGGGT